MYRWISYLKHHQKMEHQTQARAVPPPTPDISFTVCDPSGLPASICQPHPPQACMYVDFLCYDPSGRPTSDIDHLPDFYPFLFLSGGTMPPTGTRNTRGRKPSPYPRVRKKAKVKVEEMPEATPPPPATPYRRGSPRLASLPRATHFEPSPSDERAIIAAYDEAADAAVDGAPHLVATPTPAPSADGYVTFTYGDRTLSVPQPFPCPACGNEYKDAEAHLTTAEHFVNVDTMLADPSTPEEVREVLTPTLLCPPPTPPPKPTQLDILRAALARRSTPTPTPSATPPLAPAPSAPPPSAAAPSAPSARTGRVHLAPTTPSPPMLAARGSPAASGDIAIMKEMVQRSAQSLSHHNGNSEMKTNALTWPVLRSLAQKGEMAVLPCFCVPCGADLRSRTHYLKHMTGKTHMAKELRELNEMIARSPHEGHQFVKPPPRTPPTTLGGTRVLGSSPAPSPSSSLVTFACPNCGRRHSVPAYRAGKYHICVCDASCFVPKE